MKKVFKILFLITGGLTVLEYSYIQGGFTAPFAMMACIVIGFINVVLELKDRHFLDACLYVLSVAALCMGYVQLLP